MKASDYIRDTFSDFGVRLSDASVLRILLRSDIDPDTEVDKSSLLSLDVAVVESIPILLLTPQSVSEGGFSVSKTSKDSLLKWYSLRCKEIGLEDKLSEESSVKFI